MKERIVKILNRIAALITVVVRWAVPRFLLGKEKAVVAFLVPIVVANLARFVPDVHVSASLVEQVVGAAVISFFTWAAANSK